MSFHRRIRSVVFSIHCVFIAVLLLLSSMVHAQEVAVEKPRLTMENVFAAGLFRPLPSQIMWQPEGKGFLYSYQGALWRYDVETGEKKKLKQVSQITSELMKGRESKRKEADSVDATGRFSRTAMSLSPDGKLVLGAFDNDIYIYCIESGEAKFLTEDPAQEIFQTFSPDNRKVAFAKNNDIYYIDIESGVEKRLTDNGGDVEVWNGVADWVYEEELSVQRAFWWSPDSDKIAYLQFDTKPIKYFQIIDHLQRRPVPEKQKFPLTGEANSIVKLGVVGIDDAQTLWINTGEDTDIYLPRVKWTHSGKEFSYQWMNRKQNRLELRFANPKTGESRTAVVEESDTWVNLSGDWLPPATNLIFLSDDSFIWGSERTGFRHLYYYDSSGNLVKQLTDGEWMVENIYGPTPDEKSVIFKATEKSPMERNIYRVNLDGSGFKCIASEKGTHSAILSPTGEHFVRRYSSSTVPPQVALYSHEGELVRMIDEGKIPNLEKYDLTYPEYLTLESDDGDTLYAMMTKPPQFDPNKKYPAIVYVYGGPAIQLVTNDWGGFFYLRFQIIAARDYIIFTLDNRGSWGRGLAFESKVHRNLGDLELKDQIKGVEYLKSLPFVDGDKIGITGGSYGGYMTIMAMLRAPEHFKVGVAVSPGGDWHNYDTVYTERYMGTPQDNPEGYEKSSPLTYADGLEGHLYIAHGLMDNNVHVQDVIEVVEALMRAGKDFKLMLYPQERHGFSKPHHFMHFNRTMLDYFDRHLK